MADRIGQQLGNYRITRLLGSGGFSEVYLGEHIYLKSLAALKVLRTSLSDKDAQRFLAEAQTLVRLKHPHIVRVLEFAVEQGTPVLVMDYAPGGVIRETYPPDSPLPLKTVVNYVKQVASALQYAHNHNIIHRDVKPENILLGLEQELLLSDFGLSLLTASPNLLSTQEMAGTIPYMAPEQIQGKPVFASDQYGLGVVTYEWLCGTRPFTGARWELAHQHISVAPPPLREMRPELPVEVEDVVLKTLAKSPQQRFVSVQAFAHALARASQVSSPEVSPSASMSVQDRPDALFATQPDQSLRRVFLAASPADENFAARLKADLEARGMLVENILRASGQEEEVRKAIRAAQFVLMVVSPNMRSSRTIKEYLRIASMYERSLVFVRAEGDDIAAMLPEGWGKTAVIDLVDARESRYERALNELVAYLEAEEELSVTAPLGPYFLEAGGGLPEPRNPYKGLRAFTQDDVADFFGRDMLIQELVETMRGMLMPTVSSQPGTTEARLLAVIGPSGSGKSSVVMAGLLPRLWGGALPGSEDWIYLDPIVPGQHPMEALTLTLSSHFPARSLTTIREDLQDDATRGLHLLAASLAQKADTKVVLMVDQFEEVFTQTTTEEERQRFIDLIVTGVTELRGQLIVILTLRADFYDRLTQYPELGRIIEKHHQMVFPMETQDLRAIIEQPAALPDVQLTFEGNLVGDLLFETQGQVGALPLLEFTLDQLFQQRGDHQLTVEAYSKIGGVKGALAKHAEATYAALPSDEHRSAARTLFLRLIDLGTTEQDTTRRRAALSEFSLGDATTTQLLHETANTFIAARLLTTNEAGGTTTMEVSHEAVIREWKRLADWIREAREDLYLLRAIREDAAEWRRYEQSPDRLYRGTQLAEALAWRERSLLSGDEEAFLAASCAEQARQEALLAERQQQEAWQRKRYTRRTVLVGLAGVGLAVTAATISSVLLLRKESPPHLLYTYTGHTDAVNAVAWSPDGKHIASASNDTTVRVWDSSSGQNLFIYHGHTAPVNGVAWSPNGKYLASTGNDTTVRVWDATSGKTLVICHGHTAPAFNAAWSPDGSRIASSSNDRTVRIWDATSGKNLFTYHGHTAAVFNVAWSPDGKLLASASLDTTVHIWNPSSGETLRIYRGQTSAVSTAEWSPDGKRIVSASGDGTARVWDANSGQTQFTYTGHNNIVTSAQWSPDGKRIASSSYDLSVHMWDATSGKTLFTYNGHTAPVNCVEWSSDGKRLASGSADKTVRVWDAVSG